MTNARITGWLLIVTIGLLVGCGENAGSFTFEEESQEVTVEGGGPLVDLPGNALSVLKLNVDLEQQLEAHDADAAKAVYLEALVLEITDTEVGENDTDNFDFLDDVTIYVSAEGLERKQLAIVDPVPEGKQSVSFDVDSSIDLKPYIEEGMNLETEATGNRPEDNVSFKAVSTIRVDVL